MVPSLKFLVFSLLSLPFGLFGQSSPGTLIQDQVVAQTVGVPAGVHVRSEEITFLGSAGTRISGTISEPEGKGPFGAAVLVAGSGPEDRDETIAGQKPFLVLADYLNRSGFAVLRYDKRGCGRSGGDFQHASLKDFVGDAQAAVGILAGRPEVDLQRLGIVGHSEGAIVAPLVANGSQKIRFVILLAPASVPGTDIFYAQQRRLSMAAGESQDVITSTLAWQKQLVGILLASSNREELDERVHKFFDQSKTDMLLSENVRGMLSQAWFAEAVEEPWFRDLLAYDPAAALEHLHVPVLALFAAKDAQVPLEVNLASFRSALEKSGNSNVSLREFPGLNHLFQPAVTGSQSEYASGKQMMNEAALSAIGEWLLQHR